MSAEKYLINNGLKNKKLNMVENLEWEIWASDAMEAYHKSKCSSPGDYSTGSVPIKISLLRELLDDSIELLTIYQEKSYLPEYKRLIPIQKQIIGEIEELLALSEPIE